MTKRKDGTSAPRRRKPKIIKTRYSVASFASLPVHEYIPLPEPAPEPIVVKDLWSKKSLQVTNVKLFDLDGSVMPFKLVIYGVPRMVLTHDGGAKYVQMALRRHNLVNYTFEIS